MNRYLITSILFGSIIMMTLSQGLLADEIKHKFKNPSFSGIGSGAHYLTIENQEFSRKQAIEDALESARKAAEREADNTVLAKFTRNLESRIYSTLAKDIAESLFNYEGARPDLDDPSTWASGQINLEYES